MKIVKSREYYNTVSQFVNKHEVAKVITTPFNENSWTKHYLCEDGAEGTEVNRVVYEKRTIEVKGLEVDVEIKLLETEWFDTDNGSSIYMYEKY